jgi:hypothetical protein
VRNVVTVLATVFAAVAMAGIAFATVSMLPSPTRSDRIAVRLLDVLQEQRGGGSMLTIAGRRLPARCVQIGKARELVTLSDGTALVLHGSHILARRAASSPLADIRIDPALLSSAEADLSGSYALYAAEIVAQLEQGAKLTADGDDGGPITIALREERPRVELIVAPKSIRPMAAHYRSRRIDATAHFVSRAARGAGC